jgi:hypothetical protein
MKNSILIVALALLMVGCNSRSGHRRSKPVDTKRNVYVRFNGEDKDIPADGQLMVVKCSLEDTVVVEPATLDDCRRVLEENGKG